MESILEKSSTATTAAASFTFCTHFFTIFGFFVLVFKIHSPVHVAFVGLVKQTQRGRSCCGAVGLAFFYYLFFFFIFFWEVFWPRLVSIGLNASRCRPRLFDCCCSSVILSYNFIASATLCGHDFYWHVQLAYDLGYCFIKTLIAFAQIGNTFALASENKTKEIENCSSGLR